MSPDKRLSQKLSLRLNECIALFSSTRDPYRDPLQVRMQVVPGGRLFIGMSNAAQHPLT